MTGTAPLPEAPQAITHDPAAKTLRADLRRPGVDALIISCAADPGLAEVRSLVDIPVIGAGVGGSSGGSGVRRPGRCSPLESLGARSDFRNVG